MFFANKDKIRDSITKPVHDYEELVRKLLPHLSSEFQNFDNDRLTVINHGHYQGTEVFIFTDDSYQPNNYYAFSNDYGSCSGCDTLCHINDNLSCDENFNYVLTEKGKDQYLTLMLHMVQRIAKIN